MFVTGIDLEKMNRPIDIANETVPSDLIKRNGHSPGGKIITSTRMLMIVIDRITRIPIQFLLSTCAEQQIITG